MLDIEEILLILRIELKLMILFFCRWTCRLAQMKQMMEFADNIGMHVSALNFLFRWVAKCAAQHEMPCRWFILVFQWRTSLFLTTCLMTSLF